MKPPATHPLADMDVTLPDGRRGRVLKVYEKCSSAPERCMVEIDGAQAAGSFRFTVIPSADLKVSR